MTIGTTPAPKNNTLSLLVDTGSSWNWVMSCNKNEEGHWRGRVCPYFDETESSTLVPTGTRKSITYASNVTVSGPVYDEYMEVLGSKAMRAHLPLILSKQARIKWGSYHTGILGLSPSDENSGPLFINALYDQDKIQERVFAILPVTSSADTPKMTFGGYQKDSVDSEHMFFYQTGLHNITAHRNAGSSRWELPVAEIAVNGTHRFKPTVRKAMLDTGTSMILMHTPDWINLINHICENVTQIFIDSQDTAKPIKCMHTGNGFVTILNCDRGCVLRMPKIEFQLDSTVYDLRPLSYLKQFAPTSKILFDENQFSYKLSYYSTFRIFPTHKKQLILGAAFLNDFYQVYTLDRNQVGLVPSTYVNFGEGVLSSPPWSRDELSSQIMELASCFAAVILTLAIRNTCLQNASRAKVRFHNLGYCDEDGSTPVLPKAY